MIDSFLEQLESRVLLAGTPTLVADLNTNGLSSSPADFAVFNNAVYFTAYEEQHGRELWKFDGAQATRVTDIDPRPAPYAFGVGPDELTVFKGALYFRAFDPVHGMELWKYDGNTATLAADINPGVGSPGPYIGVGPTGLKVIGDWLYFSADDGVTGREIWRFDGTTASQLADLNPGKGDSQPYGKTFRFTEVAGSMYFFANPGDNRDHLFRFDGQNIVRIDQAGGVPLLSDFYDDQMIAFDGALYFTGAAPGQNLDRELWKFDGNSFSRVADIRQGPDGSWPSGYFTFNDTLYFWAQRDVSIGLELFKFDGATVTPVTQYPRQPSPTAYSQYSMAEFDGSVYLTLMGYLYRFDGSTIALVSDVPVPSGSAVFEDALYLSGEFHANGTELARYDGESINLVADVRPGTERSEPGGFSLFDGKLYFTADSDQSSHDELWVYDGSSAQIADPSRDYFEPVSLVNLNGKLYFTAANAGDVGWDLWRYDGDHSTKVLGDDNGFAFYPPGAISFGGALLLRGYGYDPTSGDDGDGGGLWTFDGTEAKLIAPNLWVDEHFADPSRYTVLNGSLYFLAAQTFYGQLELWRFDGTHVEPAPGLVPESFTPQGDMKVYDGAIYLGAKGDSPDENYELWKYDGAQAMLAAEILPGPDGSYPRGFAVHEGSLYFSASDNGGDGELYRFNSGTGLATCVTNNLTYGAGNPTSLAGLLYFTVTTVSGQLPRLWSYDGVEAKPVGDLQVNSSFFHFQNALYFSADDGLHGYELWKLAPDVPVGDLNRDGTVSIADFITLSSNFGKKNAGWSNGDVNYDGEVTISDFIDLSANFGRSNIAPPASAEAETIAASADSEITQLAKNTKHQTPPATRNCRHRHHPTRNRKSRIDRPTLAMFRV